VTTVGCIFSNSQVQTYSSHAPKAKGQDDPAKEGQFEEGNHDKTFKKEDEGYSYIL